VHTQGHMNVGKTLANSVVHKFYNNLWRLETE
jgi:hypothetical protein